MSDAPMISSPSLPGGMNGVVEAEAWPLAGMANLRRGARGVIVDGISLRGGPFVAAPLLQRALKRGIDVIVACVALVLLAPLMAFIALAIRFDSHGQSLFRQARIGRDGRHFRVLKFRTMVADAEQMRTALLSRSRDANWLHLDQDPRITRIGRLLRLTSLDELPQLWNVLTGDMSLVGPRPLIPSEHDRVTEWARLREELRPGLSGLWQVSGRTAVSFEGMLALDRLYATHWSLRTDLGILLRTPWVVVTRKGAN
jgi:lipopolysaccharide/colanic/teichoic acid biosynthesis glycosyltransferase